MTSLSKPDSEVGSLSEPDKQKTGLARLGNTGMMCFRPPPTVAEFDG